MTLLRVDSIYPTPICVTKQFWCHVLYKYHSCELIFLQMLSSYGDAGERGFGRMSGGRNGVVWYLVLGSQCPTATGCHLGWGMLRSLVLEGEETGEASACRRCAISHASWIAPEPIYHSIEYVTACICRALEPLTQRSPEPWSNLCNAEHGARSNTYDIYQ